jgi:hypothetical protein
MNNDSARNGQSQYSKPSKSPSYNLPEIKRQAGVTPFSQRLHFSSDGFCKCPFHNGDGEKTFHVIQKEDGSVVGTCFSECNKTFDAIDFIKKFDDVQAGEAIRKLAVLVSGRGEPPSSILHHCCPN